MVTWGKQLGSYVARCQQCDMWRWGSHSGMAELWVGGLRWLPSTTHLGHCENQKQCCWRAKNPGSRCGRLPRLWSWQGRVPSWAAMGLYTWEGDGVAVMCAAAAHGCPPCSGAAPWAMLLTCVVLYNIPIQKTRQVEWALFSTFREFPWGQRYPAWACVSHSIWWWCSSNRLLLVKREEPIEVSMSNWFNRASWNVATHSIRIITIHSNKSNILGEYIKLKSN